MTNVQRRALRANSLITLIRHPGHYYHFQKKWHFGSHEKSITFIVYWNLDYLQRTFEGSKVRKVDCQIKVQAFVFSISINQSICNFTD